MGGITWGGAAAAAVRGHIAAVATFGNVAGRTGGSLSTQSALLGAKYDRPVQPRRSDLSCGSGQRWSGHTEGYVPGYTTQAAAFVAGMLLNGFGQTVPGYGPPPGYGSPITGYVPGLSVHGPQPGYPPMPPAYDSQQQGPGPSTVGPVVPARPSGLGLLARPPLSPGREISGIDMPPVRDRGRCPRLPPSASRCGWKPIRATLSAIRRTSAFGSTLADPVLNHLHGLRHEGFAVSSGSSDVAIDRRPGQDGLQRGLPPVASRM